MMELIRNIQDRLSDSHRERRNKLGQPELKTQLKKNHLQHADSEQAELEAELKKENSELEKSDLGRTGCARGLIREGGLRSC